MLHFHQTLDLKGCHTERARGTSGAVVSVVGAQLGAVQPEAQYALRLRLFVIAVVISGSTWTTKPLCNNNLSHHYSDKQHGFILELRVVRIYLSFYRMPQCACVCVCVYI